MDIKNVWTILRVVRKSSDIVGSRYEIISRTEKLSGLYYILNFITLDNKLDSVFTKRLKAEELALPCLVGGPESSRDIFCMFGSEIFGNDLGSKLRGWLKPQTPFIPGSKCRLYKTVHLYTCATCQLSGVKTWLVVQLSLEEVLPFLWFGHNWHRLQETLLYITMWFI